MRPRTHKVWLAVIASRAENDLREWVKKVGRTRTGFWFGFIVVGLFGMSLVFVWPFIGLPWWLGVFFAGSLVIAGLGEGAYRTWLDLTNKLSERSGLAIGSIRMPETYSRPIEHVDGRIVRTAFTNQQAHVVIGGGDKRTPVAIRFETPYIEDLIRPSDLPKILKFRRGLSRHSIIVLSFVEGGFVLDDRNAPHGLGFLCEVYFS